MVHLPITAVTVRITILVIYMVHLPITVGTLRITGSINGLSEYLLAVK